MAGRVTLQQIAVLAEVSIATASRALNGTGIVSPEVARRVQAAAAKLRARPQPGARTRTLCFLLANRSMLHPFHAHVLMGTHEFAVEQQNQVLFYPFHYDASLAPDEIRLPLLLERRESVAGYVVGGMNSRNLLELLTRVRVPFSVLGNNVIGSWEPERYDVVWMDDMNGSYELTRYLQRFGHKAIWFVGSRRFPMSRLHEGYSRAMQEADLLPQSIESDSDDERETGYLAARSLFTKGVPVTAIFGYNDAVAQGVMEAARSCRREVPRDLSVVGFGDRPEARAVTPALTTVWAYPDQVGRRLAEFVLNRTNNPELPPQQIVLPTRLVERHSCAAPTNLKAPRRTRRSVVSDRRR
jgi:LacI family transcriptional regulator